MTKYNYLELILNFSYERVENIVRKGENTDYHVFQSPCLNGTQEKSLLKTLW